MSLVNKDYDPVQLYFNDLLGEIIELKSQLGIQDYIMSTQISSNPMVKEIQKYSSIKRSGEEEFN